MVGHDSAGGRETNQVKVSGKVLRYFCRIARNYAMRLDKAAATQHGAAAAQHPALVACFIP